MKINSEKSKEIIISFAQDGNFRSTIPNIKIDGRDIAQVCHAKLLGVTISQDLTWNKHVDNIVEKAGKRLYMLYQLKRAGIIQKDLVSVYVSVVRPVLEYALLLIDAFSTTISVIRVISDISSFKLNHYLELYQFRTC